MMKLFQSYRVGLLHSLVILLVAGSAAAGDRPTDTNCVECHPQFLDSLAGPNNHEPFEQADCMTCHKFHGFRNQQELKGSIKDVCRECHQVTEGLHEESTHYPILDDRSCLNCHNPHSSAHEKLLTASPTELCLECHDGPPDDASVLHEPFALANCIKCHNPHGSAFGAFLQMPAGYVCLECHTNILADFQPNEMHAGTDLNSCEQCHQGHFSNHAKLLKKDLTRLCIECHENIKTKIERNRRHSVLEEENCVACHLPHHKKGESHLAEVQPDLCFTCHSGIEDRLKSEFAHPPAEEEDCTLCHDPHAGVLNDGQIDLCAGCHDTEDESFLSAHNSISIRSNCTSCHDPHGSDIESMIKISQHSPFEERDCAACHQENQTLIQLKKVDICLECHDQPEPTESHSVDKVGDRVCISCHSPHASNRQYLLRPPYSIE